MRTLLLILLMLVAPVWGEQKLLALYKGSEKVDASTNFIARFCSKPLSELGYTLDYHDIETGLPTGMERYVGVVSWYQTAALKDAAKYCQWLLTQIKAGRKVVVLGNFGAFQELLPGASRWLLTHEYNSFLSPFGLEFKGMWTKDPKLLSVAHRDPEVIPWIEPAHLAHYYWLQSTTQENKPYLVVHRSDAPDADSLFAVRTPYGGYVLESYLFHDVSGKGDYKWNVDLKKFFGEVLSYKPRALPQDVALTVAPSTPRSVPAALPGVALPAGVKEEPRRILAFFQKSAEESSEKNRIHESVETILNHLGLVVEYRAIEDPLPTDMTGYRGVLTWLQGPTIPGAQAYSDWFKKQVDAGLLMVVLGDYAAFQDLGLKTAVNPVPALTALGVEYEAASSVEGISRGREGLDNAGTGRGRSVEFSDPVMMKGERPLDLAELSSWPVYKSINPANKVYLKVKDGDGQLCDAVIVTPHGGLITGDFLLYLPSQPFDMNESHPDAGGGPAVANEAYYGQLRLDAFRFFTQAYQMQGVPAFDLTTLNGSRIYFSHIDGDAMQGMSLIDRASLNAEMLMKRILSVYKLPVTVSYVTTNLSFKATPTYQRELAIARKILALPWVEPASHTRTHPFNWRVGDLARVGDRLQRVPVDDMAEIAGSVDFINQLVVPPGKKCEAVLWSGKCNPSEHQLEVADGMGVVNMNGGNPVYDSTNPYLVGVASLYEVVGGRYQWHTSGAGDFYYTGAWTRDYDGMKRLVEYFKYTESPRRLRAMNLYYHFYLAERELGIDGLKVALDYVLTQKPACMFVSDYVAIMSDWVTARMGRDGAGNLVLANHGHLRTLRFDNPFSVDVGKSQGVLGACQVGSSTYVHLDGSSVHTLVSGTSSAIYLERASHQVNGFKGLTFSLHGTGPAHFTLANVPAGTYQVKVGGEVSSVVSNGKLTWEGYLDRYQGDYAVEIRR